MSADLPRRRVAKGAAWAAPALMVAAPGPVLAASPQPCTTQYPFTVSGTSATWTNTTGSTVTLVFVNSVPLASVFHTAVTQTLVGGAPNTNAYQPANNTSYSFANTAAA